MWTPVHAHRHIPHTHIKQAHAPDACISTPTPAYIYVDAHRPTLTQLHIPYTDTHRVTQKNTYAHTGTCIHTYHMYTCTESYTPYTNTLAHIDTHTAHTTLPTSFTGLTFLNHTRSISAPPPGIRRPTPLDFLSVPLLPRCPVVVTTPPCPSGVFHCSLPFAEPRHLGSLEPLTVWVPVPCQAWCNTHGLPVWTKAAHSRSPILWSGCDRQSHR